MWYIQDVIQSDVEYGNQYRRMDAKRWIDIEKGRSSHRERHAHVQTERHAYIDRERQTCI